MNTKKVILNYLREPNYPNLIHLLELPLTNEEIIAEIGLIKIGSKYRVGNMEEVLNLLEYLESHTGRIYVFDLDSLAMLLTHRESMSNYVGKNIRIEYTKLLLDYLYNQADISEHTLRALIIIMKEGSDELRQQLYNKGLYPHHINALIDECRYRSGVSLVLYLERIISKPCQLLTDIKTIYPIVKNQMRLN